MVTGTIRDEAGTDRARARRAQTTDAAEDTAHALLGTGSDPSTHARDSPTERPTVDRWCDQAAASAFGASGAAAAGAASAAAASGFASAFSASFRSEVQSVRLSRSSCMIKVESL